MHRFGWALWAILPVVAMAYHFGPGQDDLRVDKAAGLLADARVAEAAAVDAQAAAHGAQLETVRLRRAALVGDGGLETDEIESALDREQELYAIASDAWKEAADKYAVVEQMLAGEERAIEIRWAKARAMVRAGLIWNGIDELHAILEEAESTGTRESISTAAREELAAAHYYGARILREEGRPPALWREVSGVARQHYRYLSERADDSGEVGLADDLQKNLERVLDLEQLGQGELVAKPLPKDSPRGRRPGDRDPGDGRGRSPRPPQRPGGNGAGGLLEIGPGW